VIRSVGPGELGTFMLDGIRAHKIFRGPGSADHLADMTSSIGGSTRSMTRTDSRRLLERTTCEIGSNG